MVVRCFPISSKAEVVGSSPISGSFRGETGLCFRIRKVFLSPPHAICETFIAPWLQRHGYYSSSPPSGSGSPLANRFYAKR